VIVRRLRVESETENLARVRAFVESAAAEGGVATAEGRRLALAVDEAVSNVMEHGYGGEGGRPIDVEVHVFATRVEVRIRDEGRVFDPAEATIRSPLPSPDGRLRSRGYGLLLIHRLCDEVRFSRRAERVNELVLVRFTETDARGAATPEVTT
jgi:serine/threonine-protein kinase RsbW